MLFLGQCPEHSPVRRMVFDLGSQAHSLCALSPEPLYAGGGVASAGASWNACISAWASVVTLQRLNIFSE